MNTPQPQQPNTPRFDPYTGAPLQPAQQPIDPAGLAQTGQPVSQPEHVAAEQPAIQQPTPEEIMYFAETNFRNENKKFGIKLDDRRRHMYLIGKTGMGKSTVLENMIIQDIRNGKGIAVVDPHGDLVEKVVKFIPSERTNDVIYFNPADMEHPIAFNILESVDLEYKNLVSNGLVGVFKKIWADSWGPRLEYILINAILALLEYPGSTLLGVTRMLVDAKYRKKVVKNVTDPVVKSFWIDEYNNYSEKFRNEAIAPIQNKVGQFLSSSLIRNIVGQPKSTINMRDIMDNRKILLMNLSKGRIGEENSALLGAMMITKIQLAAMSRVDTLEKERKDFYLYVDEFQNFSTESFANILSEARKYRLNLIMAHQYIEQLSDEVRAAVFGNIGTLIAFRVGAIDAEELEKEFQPSFMQEDIVTLPAYHIYLRLMIEGVASEPFSASTLPPIEGETGNRDTVIRVSRERYSNSREDVEEKIRRWSGIVHGSDKKDDEEERGDSRQRKKGGNQQSGKGKKNKQGKKEQKESKETKRKKQKQEQAPVPPAPAPAQEAPPVPDVPVPAPPKKTQPAPLPTASQPTPRAAMDDFGDLKNKQINLVPEAGSPSKQPSVPQKKSTATSLADVLPNAPKRITEQEDAPEDRKQQPVQGEKQDGQDQAQQNSQPKKKKKRHRSRKKKKKNPESSDSDAGPKQKKSQPKTIQPGQNVQLDS